MIGNAATAAAVLDPYMSPFSDDGSARIVYLIDNVIYKVERARGYNDTEWARYSYIDPNTLPPHIRVPKMHRHVVDGRVVIAAEYIDGIATGECIGRVIGVGCDCDDPCLSERVQDEIMQYIEDVSWGNVIISDGVYYIIDLEY